MGVSEKEYEQGDFSANFEVKKAKEVRKGKPRASDFSVFNFYIFAFQGLFFIWKFSHTPLIPVLQDSPGISETILVYKYRQPEIHWKTLSQKNILLFLIACMYWSVCNEFKKLGKPQVLDTGVSDGCEPLDVGAGPKLYTLNP